VFDRVSLVYLVTQWDGFHKEEVKYS